MKTNNAFCSICTVNHAAGAAVLNDSLRRAGHTEPHYVLIFDYQEKYKDIIGQFDFTPVFLKDLKIPKLDELIKKYSAFEMSNVLRPHFMEWLLKTHKEIKNLAYLDTDIYVYTSMKEVFDRVDKNKNISVLLTPHMSDFEAYDKVEDYRFENSFFANGLYNSGFYIFKNDANSMRFLEWHKNKLFDHCFNAPSRHMFVDQKILDMAPLIFDFVDIYKNRAYNIAHWNYSPNMIRCENGVYYVGKERLVFFHFSQLKLDTTENFYFDVTLDDKQIFRMLAHGYLRELHKRGHDEIKNIPYAYRSLYTPPPISFSDPHWPISRDLRERSKELAKTTEELLQIHRSFGWKSVLRARRVVNKLIPRGSTRRTLLLLMFRLARKKTILTVEADSEVNRKADEYQGDLKDMPIVTVITVVLNVLKAGREEVLRRCINSVREQSYQKIDHLVIDGGSTDGTVELLEDYAEMGWLRYVSEPDKGLFFGMNKGIKEANGRYLTFLNSDDFYHDKEGVESSIRALMGSGAVFSYAPVINLDVSTGTKTRYAPDISKVFCSVVPNHQTMFYERQAVIDAGAFNTIYRYVGDYDLTVRLCLKKLKSVYVEKCFATYSLGGNSFQGTENGKVAREVSDMYFDHYSTLYPITRAECDKMSRDIFACSYKDVPEQLAKKLADFRPYFDYQGYVQSKKNDRINAFLPERPVTSVVTVAKDVILNGREASLRRCIESVHNQNYPNVEHIVIDGGSKDGTVRILEEYSKKGWLIYISEADRGIADAMNKGVRMAHGKYITFMHSDDFYHDRNGILHSVGSLIGSGATFSYAPVVNLDAETGREIVSVPDMSRVFFTAVPNHQTMFYDRETIMKEGLFNPSYKYMADYDLTLRLCLKKYKSVFVPQCFSTYTLGGDSAEGTKAGIVAKNFVDCYFKHYNELCPISISECEKICGDVFSGDYSDIPPQLAIKLQDHFPYFDYREYLKSKRVMALRRIWLARFIVRKAKASGRGVRMLVRTFVIRSRKAARLVLRKAGYQESRRQYLKVLSFLFFWVSRKRSERKKLLIVRPDNIGDFIIFSPTLKYLRSIYRDYEMTFLGNQKVSEVAGWFPEIDRFMGIEVRRFILDPSYFVKFFFKLRKERFDVVLCPMYSRSFMSDELVNMAISSVKIGFDGDASSMYDDIRLKNENNKIYSRLVSSTTDVTPEADRYRKLVTSLGYKGDIDLIPKIPVLPDWSAEAHRLLKENGLRDGEKYVLVHMGADNPCRIWPTQKFSAVVDFFIDSGMTVVFSGTKNEAYLFEEIKSSHGKDRMVNMMGKTSFRVLAGILHGAELYFGSETSTLHLAAAVGCKTVCLLGGGHFGKHFPYGDPAMNRIVYDKNMTCKNDNWMCANTNPGKPSKCIEDISVYDAIVQITSAMSHKFRGMVCDMMYEKS